VAEIVQLAAWRDLFAFAAAFSHHSLSQRVSLSPAKCNKWSMYLYKEERERRFYFSGGQKRVGKDNGHFGNIMSGRVGGVYFILFGASPAAEARFMATRVQLNF